MKTYIKHRIYNVIDIKKLVAVEFLDFEGKYKNYVEAHDFWEMCYVQKGEITLTVNDEVHTLCEGYVSFIPPDCTHSYYCRDSKASKVFVICFECFSQYIKLLGEKQMKLGELSHVMQTIISEYKHTFYMNKDDLLDTLPNPNFGGQQLIIVQLEFLLIKLLRTLSAKEDSGLVFLSDENFYADLADVIIEYFKENISSKISLDEICRRVNYSRSFVCRIFKKQTGETIFSFFNRLKINEAKKLLEKADIQVNEIAGILGFNEAKHFGAMFKKYTGLSPGAYRKKQRSI